MIPRFHHRFGTGGLWLLVAAAGFLPLPGIGQEGATAPGGATSSLGSEPEERLVTTATKQAKQVRITSEDPQVRAALANTIDRLHQEFRQLLRDPGDAWAFPIEIHVSGAPNEVVDGPTAVIPREIQLLPDGRFQFQLFVRLHNRYDQTEVNRRFIQLLLYEMMVRPYAGKTQTFAEKKLEAPHWLIRGIDELLRHRASGRPSDLFAGIVNSRKVLPVSEIIDQSGDQPMDPVSDAVFGASAAALVAALLDQENGSTSFQGYLTGLTEVGAAGSGSQGALLRQHFPGLRGSPGALEKWWSLQIASMGQLQAFEFFSAAQTESMLDQALAVEIPAETPKTAEGIRRLLPQARAREAYAGRVHDFDDFLDHENAPAALQQSRLELRTLGLRAFPLYRGVVLKYEMAVAALIEGRTRGIADDLEETDREREAIRQSMSRVEDYMNYFEATQAEGRSEAYEQYRLMKEKLDRQGRAPRRDRISRYLDALEPEFQSP